MYSAVSVSKISALFCLFLFHKQQYYCTTFRRMVKEKVFFLEIIYLELTESWKCNFPLKQNVKEKGTEILY